MFGSLYVLLVCLQIYQKLQMGRKRVWLYICVPIGHGDV